MKRERPRKIETKTRFKVNKFTEKIRSIVKQRKESEINDGSRIIGIKKAFKYIGS